VHEAYPIFVASILQVREEGWTSGMRGKIEYYLFPSIFGSIDKKEE